MESATSVVLKVAPKETLPYLEPRWLNPGTPQPKRSGGYGSCHPESTTDRVVNRLAHGPEGTVSGYFIASHVCFTGTH